MTLKCFSNYITLHYIGRLKYQTSNRDLDLLIKIYLLVTYYYIVQNSLNEWLYLQPGGSFTSFHVLFSSKDTFHLALLLVQPGGSFTSFHVLLSSRDNISSCIASCTTRWQFYKFPCVVFFQGQHFILHCFLPLFSVLLWHGFAICHRFISYHSHCFICFNCSHVNFKPCWFLQQNTIARTICSRTWHSNWYRFNTNFVHWLTRILYNCIIC